MNTWSEALYCQPPSSAWAAFNKELAHETQHRAGDRIAGQYGQYQLITQLSECRWKALREHDDVFCSVEMVQAPDFEMVHTVKQLAMNAQTRYLARMIDFGHISNTFVIVYESRSPMSWRQYIQGADETVRVSILVQMINGLVEASELSAQTLLPQANDCFGIMDNVCLVFCGILLCARSPSCKSELEWFSTVLQEMSLNAVEDVQLHHIKLSLENNISFKAIASMPWFHTITASAKGSLVHCDRALMTPSPRTLMTPSPSPQCESEQNHKFVARALCKFSRRGVPCRNPSCGFLHLPGLKYDHHQQALQPLAKPPSNYRCHNCGSAEHYRSDCPQPQRCKFTSNGSSCTRAHCAFFHPAGTRQQPNVHDVTGQKPPLGYICFNCLDDTRSHFKLSCPHPPRCIWTTKGDGICRKNGCSFFHPTMPVTTVPSRLACRADIPAVDWEVTNFHYDFL